jgi:hypothetical protein
MTLAAGLKWIVVIMPPPPSLPDSMVIAACSCSATARLLAAHFQYVGGSYKPPSSIRTQDLERKTMSKFESHATGHSSPAPILMSFRLDRFLKPFETEGKANVARDLRPATAKKTATTLDFQKLRRRVLSSVASKVLTQFDDSHFCNMGQQRKIDKFGARANNTRSVGFPVDSNSKDYHAQ